MDPLDSGQGILHVIKEEVEEENYSEIESQCHKKMLSLDTFQIKEEFDNDRKDGLVDKSYPSIHQISSLETPDRIEENIDSISHTKVSLVNIKQETVKQSDEDSKDPTTTDTMTDDNIFPDFPDNHSVKTIYTNDDYQTQIFEENSKEKVISDINQTSYVCCKHCRKKFYKHNNTKNYLLGTHSEEKPSVNVSQISYVCKHCGITFYEKDDYKNHILENHSKGQAIFECDKCRTKKRYLVKKEHTQTSSHETVLSNQKANVLKLLEESFDGKITIKCNECKAKFLNKLDLRNHFELEHGQGSKTKYRKTDEYDIDDDTPTYVCKHCNESFLGRYNYMRHMIYGNKSNNLAEGRPQFQCYKCSQKFLGSCAYTRHFTHSHKSQNFKCPYCEKRFAEEATHLTHLRFHKCYKSCENSKDFTIPTNDDGRINCDLCDNAFSDETSLYKHMENMHIKKKSRYTSKTMYKCVNCVKTFEDVDSLIDHALSHCLYIHKHSINCCRKHKDNKKELQLHVISDHRIDQLQCAVCDKEFPALPELEYHFGIEHLNEKHQCGFCENEFEQEVELKQHLHSDHKDVTCVCTICHPKHNMYFHTLESFSKHMHLYHKETKFKYQCKNCQEGFKNNWQLKAHEEECRKQVVFRCEFCEKKTVVVKKVFDSEESLKKHMSKYHVMCSICQLYFNGAIAMRKHHRSEHKTVCKTPQIILKKKV